MAVLAHGEGLWWRKCMLLLRVWIHCGSTGLSHTLEEWVAGICRWYQCRNNIQNSWKSRNIRESPLDHYGDLCELQQHLLDLLDLVQDLVVEGTSRRIVTSTHTLRICSFPDWSRSYTVKYEIYTDYFIVHSVLQACHSRCIYGLIAVPCALQQTFSLIYWEAAVLSWPGDHLSWAVKACSYAAAASTTRAGHITLLPRDLPPITLPPLTQQCDSFPHSIPLFRLPTDLAWAPLRGSGRISGLQKFYNPI